MLDVKSLLRLKIIFYTCKIFPDVGISIFAKTLIVESINLCDLSALMVSSQDRDPGAEPDLEGDEEGDGLHAVVAPVHVVTHEQVVSVRRLPYLIK